MPLSSRRSVPTRIDSSLALFNLILEIVAGILTGIHTASLSGLALLPPCVRVAISPPPTERSAPRPREGSGCVHV
eukprot:scaffold19836_cov79-Isochrysis_galbana.AAC.2